MLCSLHESIHKGFLVVFQALQKRLWIHTCKHGLFENQDNKICFIYDKNNPKHKCPDNNAEDLPDNVRFGDALGEWENEFSDDEWIDEIICTGAKS